MNILEIFKRNEYKLRMDKNHIKWMGLQAPYTPDISELEEQEFVLIFACDDLMYGCKNYEIIRENSVRVERGFTRHKFNMYSDGNGGAVPLIARRTSPHVPRVIKGELHLVQPLGIPAVDNKYMNGVRYHRIRVPIVVPYRDYSELNNGKVDTTGKRLPPLLRGHKFTVSEEKQCVLDASMYVGVSQYWSKIIDGGYNHPQIPNFTTERQWPPSYYKFPKNAK